MSIYSHSNLSGPLPPPTNLICMITPRGLNVTWEPVVDGSCAMSDVNYLVTVIRASDMMTIISSMPVTETTVELTNTLVLQPNIRYIIYVSTTTITGGCEGLPGNVSCEIYACFVSGKYYVVKRINNITNNFINRYYNSY